MNIISIDPGTHYCGYAYWLNLVKGWKLHKYGLVRGGKSTSTNWETRCFGIHEKLDAYFTLSTLIVVVEFPEFQVGSRGSNASRQGDVLKLAYLCGMLVKDYGELITPSQWKGQLSKEMTATRMQRIWPSLKIEQKIDYNWADAIMLGVMGRKLTPLLSEPTRLDL